MNQPIHIGTTLMFSEGVYDDYTGLGIYKVIAPFVPKYVLNTYLENNPNETEKHCFQTWKFIAYMVDKGLIEEVDHKEIHLGSYGIAPNWGHS